MNSEFKLACTKFGISVGSIILLYLILGDIGILAGIVFTFIVIKYFK